MIEPIVKAPRALSRAGYSAGWAGSNQSFATKISGEYGFPPEGKEMENCHENFGKLLFEIQPMRIQMNYSGHSTGC